MHNVYKTDKCNPLALYQSYMARDEKILYFSHGSLMQYVAPWLVLVLYVWKQQWQMCVWATEFEIYRHNENMKCEIRIVYSWPVSLFHYIFFMIISNEKMGIY